MSEKNHQILEVYNTSENNWGEVDVEIKDQQIQNHSGNFYDFNGTNLF